MTKKEKFSVLATPFENWSVRIAAKEETTGLMALLIRGMVILAALLFSMLIIFFLGYNPIKAFLAMIKGSFGSVYGLKNTITVAIPLLIVAVGLTVAFSMKYWNIGAEGQMVFAAICATGVARLVPSSVQGAGLILLMILAGMLGGALWALIPGIFRAWSGTNETLFTLMMNYLAIKIAVYLRCEIWKDPEAMGFPQIAAIPDHARLPQIFGVHIGWIIALIVALLVTIFLRDTKKGYEIRVVGESDRTAQYAGMNVSRVILLGVFISGAIIGLAGVLKLNGVAYTLSEEIGGGNGFTAIIIAWLSQLHIPVMVFVSVLFAAMEQGSLAMELSLGVPASVCQIIEGLILFSALSAEFFIRYRIVTERIHKDPDADGCHKMGVGNP